VELTRFGCTVEDMKRIERQSVQPKRRHAVALHVASKSDRHLQFHPAPGERLLAADTAIRVNAASPEDVLQRRSHIDVQDH
jgi:hypothetical protein